MKKIFYLMALPIIIGCSSRETREVKNPFSGQLAEQHQVIKTKDGSFLKDGYYKIWHPNGQIEIKGNYKENKKHGEWLEYYENGQLAKNLTYYNDTLNGELFGYYKNGTKKYEAQQVMGKYEKVYREWYDTGTLRYEYNYENGFKNGVQKAYYTDGQIESEIEYYKGVKEGAATYWYENGQKKSQGKYSNDDVSGNKWEYWNEDGTEWLNKKELILGVWHNGEDSKREFKANGECEVTYDIDGSTKIIDYRVSGDDLMFHFGVYTFTHFDKNSFTIKDYRGKEWNYTRL